MEARKHFPALFHQYLGVALMAAIDSGSVPAVKAALDKGADVNGLPDSRVEESC
jgi:hypothetical protein